MDVDTGQTVRLTPVQCSVWVKVYLYIAYKNVQNDIKSIYTVTENQQSGTWYLLTKICQIVTNNNIL